MNSQARSEAVEVLAELYAMSPDVRLGQLLAHVGFLGEDQTGNSLRDIDDEQLLAILYHHRAELVARASDSSAASRAPSVATFSPSLGPTPAAKQS